MAASQNVLRKAAAQDAQPEQEGEHQRALQRDLRADAGVGFCHLDGRTQVLTLDSVARAHYGLTDEVEVNTGLVLTHIHPEDQKAFEGMFFTATKTKSEKLRHRVPLGDGNFRYLEMFVRIDNSTCFHGILMDVTEAMEVQNTLAREQEHFKVLASGVPGRFSYIDQDYRVQFLSNEFRVALGLGDRDITGLDSSELFGEQVWAERKPEFERALTGETFVWEDQSTDTEGSLQHDLVTYQPNHDKDGKVIGVFTLRMDITNIRNMELELRDLHENLLRSNKDLEQFAYVASHDLKAPLRAIQVLADWLQEDLADYNEGDVQENIGLLNKRAARLSNLLDDLLAYSRAGRQGEAPTDIDLRELVEEVADLTGHGDTQVVGWEGDFIAQLQTDHAALHQVMRNLIGNAIKHHPGPDCRVRVSAKKLDALVEVTIEDNGEGIAPEFAEKIFQMFQTLKPRDEVEGSGMGLAIVKRLVNHHGGEIWIETPASGVGAAFKFTWQQNAADTQ